MIILLLLISGLPQQLLARNYYVKQNGSNANQGTNWATAWKTLQKAADTMASGDQSYVSNGTYSEQVLVSGKNNFSFTGYGSSVLISGRWQTNYSFRIKNSQYIKIENFRICSNLTAMVFLTNSDYCQVNKNIIFENTQTQDYGSGIKLIDSCYNRIFGNLIYKIEANTFGPNNYCYGVYIYLSHTNTVMSNEIRESGSGALSGGVDIWCRGIYVLNSRYNLVRFNFIHDMDHWGIDVEADNTKSEPYTYLNNKIMDNTVAGMDRGISTHDVQSGISDGLKGQVIGRNKIFNTAKGIEWNTSILGSGANGGWCYKNSIASKKTNYSYFEGFPLSQWPKIKFVYNSVRGYYYGIPFQNYDYQMANNIMASNYSRNLIQTVGGSPQELTYSCTQAGYVGAGVSAGTGNISGDPLFTGVSNTRLKWNSPCIGAAQPDASGIRGSMGAHTAYLRAEQNSANNTTIYTMTFVTSPFDGYIPPNGRIRVDFPSGFLFLSPSVISHNLGGTLSLMVSGSSIMFTRTSGSTFLTNSPVRIVFSGVNNPGYNGDAYYCLITTMSNNGTIIEQEDSNNFRIINGISRSNMNSPWPMFQNNARHTGSTNKTVLGAQKNPYLKWFYDSGNVNGSPVIGQDQTVYFADNIKLYALTNGKLKWAYSLENNVYSSPALDIDSTVYIADNANKLYAVRNGSLLWSFTATNNFNRATPVVGTNGLVYIGDTGGILYAVKNGQVKWTFQDDTAFYYSAPAIGPDGTIYIGGATWPNYRLYAVTNGVKKWSYGLTNNLYSSPVVGKNNTVYCATYHWSTSKLFAITNIPGTTNGSVKWACVVGPYLYSSPAVDTNSTVYVGSGDNNLYAVTNGQVKWTFSGGDEFNSSPTIGKDGTIYIGNFDYNLYAVTNGSMKWSYNTGSWIYYSTPAIDRNGTIYIGNSSGLYAVDEENPPRLSWSSNTSYSNDGVRPDRGYSGQFFRFEIKYSDMDNDYQSTNQVWVDMNDDGTYRISEKFPLYQ
ncbi:MAG: PQQ-binding-like beta-propeller repeat protein, partial [bacterium]|nr:PQQ-binding-like beta-propeller repeat protein [bacterium]